MTRFLLVRHTEHDWLARGLAGRLPEVSLNAQGFGNAQALVQRLADERIDAIVSSPQPRARQTVAPLAEALGLEVQVDPAFDEVDFGDWTGWSFERLEREDGAAWRHWCERRGSAQPPGGERFADVPLRMRAGLERLAQRWPQGTIVVASHGDPIRSVVASARGMSLDELEQLHVAPGSISVIECTAEGLRVQSVGVLDRP